jgi:hypothetical protein
VILATFLVGVAIGFIPPILLGTRHARELRAENDALRSALRHVRGITFNAQLLGVARYIDGVLADEAGA